MMSNYRNLLSLMKQDVQYMSIKSHHTVTVTTLVLL